MLGGNHLDGGILLGQQGGQDKIHGKQQRKAGDNPRHDAGARVGQRGEPERRPPRPQRGIAKADGDEDQDRGRQQVFSQFGGGRGQEFSLRKAQIQR